MDGINLQAVTLVTRRIRHLDEMMLLWIKKKKVCILHHSLTDLYAPMETEIVTVSEDVFCLYTPHANTPGQLETVGPSQTQRFTQFTQLEAYFSSKFPKAFFSLVKSDHALSPSLLPCAGEEPSVGKYAEPFCILSNGRACAQVPFPQRGA